MTSTIESIRLRAWLERHSFGEIDQLAEQVVRDFMQTSDRTEEPVGLRQAVIKMIEARLARSWRLPLSEPQGSVRTDLATPPTQVMGTHSLRLVLTGA
jgi:hypothetical protein